MASGFMVNHGLSVLILDIKICFFFFRIHSSIHPIKYAVQTNWLCISQLIIYCIKMLVACLEGRSGGGG